MKHILTTVAEFFNFNTKPFSNAKIVKDCIRATHYFQITKPAWGLLKNDEKCNYLTEMTPEE